MIIGDNVPVFSDLEAKSFYADLTAGTVIYPNRSSDELGELVLHISEGCNLACIYCFADKGQYGTSKPKWMTADQARRTVRSAARNYRNIVSVKLFGGEPFMNLPAIRAAIDEFRSAVREGLLEKEPRYYAVSNMTVVTPAVLALIQDAAIIVTGSLDGPPEVNDVFRVYPNGRGAFRDIDRGIHTMCEKTGQPLSLEVVYGPHHLRQGWTMVDIHQYLTKRYGIEIVVLHPMTFEPGVAEESNWCDYNKQIRGLSEDYGNYIVSRINDGHSALLLAHALRNMRRRARKDIYCSLGVDTVTVTVDGKIYPCYSLIGHLELVMAESLDTWDREDHAYISVESIFTSTHKSENSQCSSCDVLTTCSACPGSMMQVNGSLDAPISTHCSNLIGYTEGLIKGLLLARNNAEVWPIVSKAISDASSGLEELANC